jgi:hypothetical protein
MVRSEAASTAAEAAAALAAAAPAPVTAGNERLSVSVYTQVKIFCNYFVLSSFAFFVLYCQYIFE